MGSVVCEKCDRMVAEAAVAKHLELNHPKKHLGNLAALERGREILKERRIEREIERARLSVAWNGAKKQL